MRLIVLGCEDLWKRKLRYRQDLCPNKAETYSWQLPKNLSRTCQNRLFRHYPTSSLHDHVPVLPAMSLPSSTRTLAHLHRQISRCSSLRHRAYSTVEPPKRFAIIGSGPAACYTAQYIRRSRPDALIDMYDRNPVPYGLVRYGVAPDHKSVKVDAPILKI